MKNIHAHLARRINEILKSKAMSADRLALEIGMNSGFLYRVLTGKKKAGLDSVKKIADGLEVKVEELFKE